MDKRLIPGPKEWPYGYNAINSWKDEDGYTVDDADEKRTIITDLVNGIPAIDAIPVEWLREWQDEVGTLNEWWPIIERIITVWQEEQVLWHHLPAV